MKTTHRLLALLLAVLFVLGVSACGNPAPAAEGPAPAEEPAAQEPAAQEPANVVEGSAVSTADVIPNDGKLTVGWTKGVEGFNTVRDNNYIGNYLVYEGMFVMNPDTNEVDSIMVENYEWVDECTLNIQLKDNIYFSNGDQLTSEDVLWSMYRYIEAGSNLSTYFSVYDWDKCMAADDLNLTLVTFEPYGPGLTNLTRPILNKSYCETCEESDWWDKPCGTGPYEVVENVSGSHTSYALRGDYWDAANNSFDFDSITVRSYSEASTMFIDFENKDIDVAFNVSTSDAERVINGDVDCGYVLRSNNDVINFVLSEGCSYFDDVKVRQAIAHALDVDAIGEAAYGKTAIHATSCVSASLTKFYENVGQYEYDPELAKQLLEEAGYGDGFTLKMVIVNFPNNQTLAEAIQLYLSQVGITLEIEAYPIPTAVPMFMEGAADCVLNQQNGGAYLLEPNQVFDTSRNTSTNKCVRITDETFNGYLETALFTVDTDVRAENYKAAQQWQYDNCRAIPIVEDSGLYVFTSKIASFNVTSLTYPNLRFVNAAS